MGHLDSPTQLHLFGLRKASFFRCALLAHHQWLDFIRHLFKGLQRIKALPLLSVLVLEQVEQLSIVEGACLHSLPIQIVIIDDKAEFEQFSLGQGQYFLDRLGGDSVEDAPSLVQLLGANSDCFDLLKGRLDLLEGLGALFALTCHY